MHVPSRVRIVYLRIGNKKKNNSMSWFHSTKIFFWRKHISCSLNWIEGSLACLSNVNIRSIISANGGKGNIRKAKFCETFPLTSYRETVPITQALRQRLQLPTTWQILIKQLPCQLLQLATCNSSSISNNSNSNNNINER